MTDAEERAQGIAAFRAYMEGQRQLLVSESPEDADFSTAQYEAVSRFWAAIEAANPVGLRAPTVECEYDDEEDDISEDGGRVYVDWSCGRAWLWLCVYQDGKCGILYRNFETGEEVLVGWPTLTEALPRCLVLVCKHLENTIRD